MVSRWTSSPTVLVVTGVSGTGTSTVAGLLAAHLGWLLQEGDDLHPEANVVTMEQGTPAHRRRSLALAGHDRRLDRRAGRADEPGIVTCSALRRAYRDRLRRPNVVLVHVHGTPEGIRRRMAHRVGHLMPLSLLDSQLDTLEPPGPDERVITVDVEGTPQEEVAGVLEALGRP